MANLPYLAAPTNIPKAFEKIKQVPTPPRITQDFVKTKLQVPSSSGNQMTAFLKRLGFANADGTPSELYIKFRNKKTAGRAVEQAIRTAYAPLYDHNEYMHDLSEDDLRGLIVQITGAAEDARSVDLILRCIMLLKGYAIFDGAEETEPEGEGKQEAQQQTIPNSPVTPPVVQEQHGRHKKLGMNLSYTINLNLPPSTDIAVFNAIFKSLKENLLKDIDE